MSETDIRPAALDSNTAGWLAQMMTEPAFARDPRPYYELLRQGAPWRDDMDMAGRGATVLVSRFEDVERTLRSPKLFSSAFGDGLAGIGNDRPLIPLQIDPPEHKKYRVLLDPYLAPRKLAALEAQVAQLVNQLIDGFASKGSCDFIQDFAVPLPCTVFLRLIGLPLEDLDICMEIKEGILRGGGEMDPAKQGEARVAAGRRCYEYFDSALDRIEKDQVSGLLYDLMHGEVEGNRLTRDEILDICYLLMIAGLDTVTDSLCCFWVYLAGDPGQQRRIADDPSIISAAIEELLRWESPVSGVARIATQETEISGCPVHAGDTLLVMVGAANTDPDGLDGAERVDFDRAVNRHYAFGGGIHRCLGSHLARLELRVAMREWHRRIPNYSIADDADLEWAPMLRVVRQLPLVFPAA